MGDEGMKEIATMETIDDGADTLHVEFYFDCLQTLFMVILCRRPDAKTKGEKKEP